MTKLKSLLSEKQIRLAEKEKAPRAITKEERDAFLESVRKFPDFGKGIYRESKLNDITQTLGKLVEFASRFTVEESGEWFDSVTVNRHMKRLKESYGTFQKTAEEMNVLQQRLESCYEDIGGTLAKYYEMHEEQEDDEADDNIERNMTTESKRRKK